LIAGIPDEAANRLPGGLRNRLDDLGIGWAAFSIQHGAALPGADAGGAGGTG